VNIFCLLWLPFFYFFWRSFPENEVSGGGWAFILGCLAAVLQVFIDTPFDPGGFGINRWFFGFFTVSFPVIIPLLLYLLMICLGFIKENHNFSVFALAWIIPGAVINAISWTGLSDPIFLVLIPILWTSVATGIPFFIRFIYMQNIIITILSSLGILMVPLAAASSYWAFFSQDLLSGFLFLTLAIIPMILSVIFSFLGMENYSY